MAHLGGVNTQFKDLDTLLQIDQINLRCRIIKHQRTAFGGIGQDLGHFFAVGFCRCRYGQYHTSQVVRQRPVNELLGDKRFVRHDDLFAIPVRNGGGAGVDLGDGTGQVADRHGITNADRFFKQDDQAGDKVGEDLLHTKAQPHAERGHYPLQFRPFDTDPGKAEDGAEQQQQILGNGGDGVAGAR
ncbi:hypothetical protein D3C80_803250 [compost metagenome]